MGSAGTDADPGIEGEVERESAAIAQPIPAISLPAAKRFQRHAPFARVDVTPSIPHWPSD